jgi:hypothetical protein
MLLGFLQPAGLLKQNRQVAVSAKMAGLLFDNQLVLVDSLGLTTLFDIQSRQAESGVGQAGPQLQ